MRFTGFTQRIEDDFTGSGHHAIARRMALRFLELPGVEAVGKIKADHDFAVTAAHIGDVIRGSIKAHESVLAWLQAAETRLLLCVAVRPDMVQIIAEAKGMSDGSP